MSIDPSGLPTEYSNAMATVIGIYAAAIFGTIVLVALLLGVAHVMDWLRSKRLSAATSTRRDDPRR
jgi:hypothetical protein